MEAVPTVWTREDGQPHLRHLGLSGRPGGPGGQKIVRGPDLPGPRRESRRHRAVPYGRLHCLVRLRWTTEAVSTCLFKRRCSPRRLVSRGVAPATPCAGKQSGCLVVWMKSVAIVLAARMVPHQGCRLWCL